MPKKLRLTVDFMAFKCRTLRVKLYTLAASPLGKGPKYPLDSLLNQPVSLNILGKVKSLPLSKIKKWWSSS